MPTVSTDADAYQDLDAIRERIQFDGEDFFDDNSQLRFDELLVRLEAESRGIFETLWGDQTPLEETGRTDERRATDDAAMALVYPINDVTTVERKVALSSDWDELDADWYDWTDHRLVLARRPNTNSMRLRQRGNPLTRNADRATWSDIATKLRITYDRGFTDGAPADIKSVQIQMIQNFLKDRKGSETFAAASPEEMAQGFDTASVVTEEVRERISDVTSPGMATLSV